MELSDEPKSWVEEARNRVKRIADLDPRDRLDIVYGIGLCCSTLAKSMQGWMQWIGNLSLKDFEQPELQEIFGTIKKATVQLMELDIDKTEKYEQSHGQEKKPRARTISRSAYPSFRKNHLKISTPPFPRRRAFCKGNRLGQLLGQELT